jgi:hypothetical protein
MMRFLATRLSPVTRRRLVACAAVAVCAVPTEVALLGAIHTPRAGDGARAWADSLSADRLQDAAQRIQDYPYFYRRAIMAALDPDDRAAAWRGYLRTWAATHPLDPASRAVINRAIAAMTPDVFDDAAPANQLAELSAVFDISVGLFGRRTAIDLFMRLGPDDGLVAPLNALPITERISARLRGWMTVNAAAFDCDCTTAFGASCDVSGLTGAEVCSTGTGCEPDVSWPMSGAAWAFPANGTCSNLPSGR